MTEPREASAAELVQSLLAPAPSEVFRLERRAANGDVTRYPVRVRLLRVEEDIQCLLDSQKHAKDVGELKDYGDVYRESQAVELLTRALCHVETRTRPDGTDYYPPLFTSPAQLRQSFTAPELAQCLNMYEIVKAKYGGLETFDPADTELWISRLAAPLEGPYFLSALDSQAWPLLLLHMAQWAQRLCQETGRPLMNWRDSSESDQPSSDEDTGFSTVPQAESSDGIELPTDALLTKEQARERVKRMRKKT